MPLSDFGRGQLALARLSQSRGVLTYQRHISRVAATRRFRKPQSEDLPSSIERKNLSFCSCLVSALHQSEEGWKRPPLFQPGRKPADLDEQNGAAHRAVSG